MTGPIVFSNEAARDQLLEEGEVITFRPMDENGEGRTTGKTWWRKERTGPKEGDVYVEEIRKVDPVDPWDLNSAQPFSGFPNVPEWQLAIRELHDEMPETGALYRVTLFKDWSKVDHGPLTGHAALGFVIGQRRPDDTRPEFVEIRYRRGGKPNKRVVNRESSMKQVEYDDTETVRFTSREGETVYVDELIAARPARDLHDGE